MRAHTIITGLVLVSFPILGCDEGELRQPTQPIETAATDAAPAANVVAVVPLPPHPESAVPSPDGDAYLVSNLGEGTGGGPVPHLFAEDNDGFISKVEVNPDGSLGGVDEDWISGATTGADVDGVTGITVDGTDLYAVDRDEILVFDVSDLDAPTFTMSIALPSPGDRVLPNDIILDGVGTIYLTDTGLDRDLNTTDAQSVWRLPAGASDWELLASFSAGELVCPNGVNVDGDGNALFITFCSNTVYRIDGPMQRTAVATVEPGDGVGRLDGLVVRGDGSLVLSDWRLPHGGSGKVHATRGTPAGMKAHTAVAALNLPADIGFDEGRSRVLIPSDGDQALKVVEIR